MNLASALAGMVVSADASMLTASSRRIQHRHVVDTLGALAAGLGTAEGKALTALPAAAGIAPPALMAAVARLTEIDDIHLRSCTTPSAAVVPVALAFASEREAGDADAVMSAILAGTRVMTRLGVAVEGASLLYRGIWPSLLFGGVAAAATLCRLWRLDIAPTAHALSLAMADVSGRIDRIEGAPSGRWLLFARAVGIGIAAAFAARAGYRGAPDALGNHAALAGRDLDEIVAGLSTATDDVYATLSLKPFCSAKQCVAALEAFRDIVATGVRPGEMESVAVFVPPAYAGMISRPAVAGARSTTLVSVAHQIARAALDPNSLYDIDRSGSLDPAVIDLADKVKVEAAPELAAAYPRSWPAVVEAVVSGRRVRARVDVARGDPERPLTMAEIEAKLARSIRSDGLPAAIRALTGIEEPADDGAYVTAYDRLCASAGRA